MNHDFSIQPKSIVNNSYGVFDDWGSYHLNTSRVYFHYFGIIPCTIEISRVKIDVIIAALDKEKKEEIEHIHSSQRIPFKENKLKQEGIVYIMKDGTLINIGEYGATVAFEFKNSIIANVWVDFLKHHRSKASDYNSIYLVTASSEGLRTTPIEIKRPKLALKDNYNDDLVEINKELIIKLKKKDTSGLFLFHGLPGTGKSTYIKYLIHQLNQDIIFMSPRLAGNLDAPDLTSFLIDNMNSIIVIEDAEDLISSREGERNSSISTLLNLTDGLLGESLHIKVIATFNTEAKNIDKALMRKGRLEFMYHFKELSISKSNNLMSKLKINFITTKEMTLTDIYNFKKNEYKNNYVINRIGFIS